MGTLRFQPGRIYRLHAGWRAGAGLRRQLRVVIINGSTREPAVLGQADHIAWLGKVFVAVALPDIRILPGSSVTWSACRLRPPSRLSSSFCALLCARESFSEASRRLPHDAAGDIRLSAGGR